MAKSTTANAPQGSGTTAYLYDGWNVIAEYAMVGGHTSLTAANVWGTDLSGFQQGAGGVGGLLTRTTGGTTLHYAYDANGNVTELIDAVGGIAAHYEYGPFGEPLRATGTMADQNPFRFSTKYQDSETGLEYYGYRYYQPIMGRWINVDPRGESGGKNLYAFVVNNPLQYIDPFGLELTEFSADSSSYPWQHGAVEPPFLGYTKVTKWTNQVAKVSGTVFFDVTIKGGLGIKIYIDPSISDPTQRQAAGGGTVIDHERGHVEIFKKWWNELKKQVDPFELWRGQVGTDVFSGKKGHRFSKRPPPWRRAMIFLG